ncbi:MAG: hypothetical protein JOY95_07670 [Silvibacterium sp.]|nr:hypothetical protein [Silvibacterium sp.]
MEKYREVSDLLDPRPGDGGRLSYDGMPLLPVSYECKWMVSDTGFQQAVMVQLFVIGSEKETQVRRRSDVVWMQRGHWSLSA